MLRKLVVFALVLFAVAHADKGASLLVYKSLLSEEPVEGQELSVVVRIFNVGDSAAYDVSLNDDTWSANFEKGVGLELAKWDKLTVGANVSHVYSVRPIEAGVFETAPATVLYRNTPNGVQQVALRVEGWLRGRR
eukprot:TRINITY_DN5777_c0_g1_i2.p1 TRINITY_DN5777_c0_g1~~TRINITY_DN5777_c0_g1_i2.p1  ORF type:complete len:135 (-),score=24.85 TRINITY_DN5777_c0_g1_i2:75-479(-)